MLLTTNEVAKRLALSPYTLKVWRMLGKGPKFVKIGGRSIRYSEKALADYLAKARKAG